MQNVDGIVNKTPTGTGWSQGEEPPTCAGWEGKKSEKATDPPGSWSSWGKKDVETKGTAWNERGSNKSYADQTDFPAKDSSEGEQWGTQESSKAHAGSSASWGQAIRKSDRASWDVDRSEKAKEEGESGKWGSMESDKRSNNTSGLWDRSRKAENNQTGWKKANSSVPKVGDQLESFAGWGKKVDGFGENSKQDERPDFGESDRSHGKSGAWDSNRKTDINVDQTGWGKMDWGAPNSEGQSGSSASWGKKANLADEKSKVNEEWGSLETGKGQDKSGSWDWSKQHFTKPP